LNEPHYPETQQQKDERAGKMLGCLDEIRLLNSCGAIFPGVKAAEFYQDMSIRAAKKDEGKRIFFTIGQLQFAEGILARMNKQRKKGKS
jgi:hypothetical protein